MKDCQFDVIVMGGGHAGCEAAHASAALGARTLLLTLNPERIGFLSCNPAMGGLAKGQLIREIDALGGLMAQITDRAAIQYRRLNSSKGPAVRSSRAQCDKVLYASEMQARLRNVSGLDILAAELSALDISNGSIQGVRLKDDSVIRCRAVILTSGTFLRGCMFTGLQRSEGGRLGDAAANDLSGQLHSLGFRLMRLKTGTPPRVHAQSIDWSGLEEQPGDRMPQPFSFFSRPKPFPYLPQLSCHLTYTNPITHQIIAEHFHESPLFTGMIEGVGPRYCPSIEDKVKRFGDRDRHQIFLEPEGLNTPEIYVNGISTSLPAAVQERFVRTISGLERAVILKSGYAVEYDAIDARQLCDTYESKDIKGLYCAGQINGTSGYEEAGAQGILAGINAALALRGDAPFVLRRDEAYAGVLTDDLILRGTDEPYRMFTSRAEHRLYLREDNADLRLSERAHTMGLLGTDAYELFHAKRTALNFWRERLDAHAILPRGEVQHWLQAQDLPLLQDRLSASQFLRRPEVDWNVLCAIGFGGEEAAPEIREQLEIQIKYAGYIQRDLDLLAHVRRDETVAIPPALAFASVPGLSHEVIGRLQITRPQTLGQASRIPGITPAAVANLMIYLSMRHTKRDRPLSALSEVLPH